MLNEAIIYVTTLRYAHPMVFLFVSVLFVYLLSKEVLYTPDEGEDE